MRKLILVLTCAVLLPAGAAQDRPSNRIQLRSLTLFHILLHGAPHIRRHGTHAGEDRFKVDSCAFRHTDGARFSNTSFSQTPPLRIGKDLTDGLMSGGRAQRKRREESQLAPHQGRLVLDEAAGNTDLLKLIESNCKHRPSGG